MNGVVPVVNKHIEIVRSSISTLSSMSQASCDGIVNVLRKRYKRVGVTTVNNIYDLEKLVNKKPDLVFVGMKYVPAPAVNGKMVSSKIWITEFLEQNNIAYTGSGPSAHELELSKQLAKQRVLEHGLSTSKFYVVKQNEKQDRSDNYLTFPLFVKPTDRGGGLGIDSFSVANNFDQLNSKVQSITADLQSDSLVEEYLPGREFSVAILKDENSDTFTIMPLELVAPADQHGARLLSAEIKSMDSESFMAVTDWAIKTSITTLAMNVFHALGARDYGRIDIRLDGAGIPHFLEANLLPSLIKDYGNFPKACQLNIGLDYESMLLRIVDLGLNRSSDIERTVLEPMELSLPLTSTALQPVG